MNKAIVVRTGWLLARRALWRAGRPRRGLLTVVLTLLTAVALGSLFVLLFRTLREMHAPAGWSECVLEWAFTLTFVMLALSHPHTAVEAAIAAADLPLLRAAPITPRALLVLKLFATLTRTLPPVLSIALPASLAYGGTHGGVSPIALLLALFTLWVVPLGLGTALALPLLRIAPAARLRESLAVLATFAFVAGWLVNAFWLPRLAVATGDLATVFRALPNAPTWSPATWAAHAALHPDFGARIGCLLACVAAMGLASHATARLLSEVQALAAPAAARVIGASARRARTLPLAFLRRDAALVTRDWPVLLDAAANLALWSLLPLAVLPLSPLPRLELARAMLVALSVGLGNDVAARAIPLERSALAWARLSPVGGARWLRMRALGVGVIAGGVLITATAVVCAALGLHGTAVMDSLAFGTAAALTATAIGMGLGAVLGDRAWTDPRAMLGVGGRSLATAAMLVQAGGWLALSHVLSPGKALAPLTLLALLGTGALLAAIVLTLTARALERQEFTAG